MRSITVAALALLLLLTPLDRAVAQTGQDLFQQALVRERANGDLRGAIAIYERIVREFRADRPLAANALVQLGSCYERLGSTEAERAYQRVVREFADQADPVTRARARLAALQAAAPTVAGRGPVAQRLLSSQDSTVSIIDMQGVIVPSPDGRRVAYAQTGSRDAGVYVRDLASGAVQQVAAREPTANRNNWSVVWSADGRRLAFPQTSGETQATTTRIFDFTSRETVAIPGLDARGLYLLDWSRDGRYLLCNKWTPNSPTRMSSGHTLELVTVSDGRMTTLSDSIWGGIRASFSPDGRFVAYAAGRYGSWSLYVQPVAGGARQRIAETRGGVYLHPLWSPDGQAIAYQQPDGIWVAPMANGVASGTPRLAYRINSPRWAVAWTESGGLYFTLDAESTTPYQVAVDPATGRPGDAGTRELPHYPDDQMYFAWSPDMQRIAFAEWGGDLTVYAVDGDRMTSQKVAASDEGVIDVWWSSDGREVQYQHFDRTGVTVRALDAATGRVRELVPRIRGGRTALLSADGRGMIITRPAADSALVEVVVAVTGQTDGRVVATTPSQAGSGWFVRPRLSPRGDQVLLVRGGGLDAGTAGTLWVVASDGTGARQLATASALSSAMWDSTGRFIGYTGRADGRPVLRVVEVATGVERDLPLPSARGRWQITDWSRDGRFIGVEQSRHWWEYWVVQGLLEGGR